MIQIFNYFVMISLTLNIVEVLHLLLPSKVFKKILSVAIALSYSYSYSDSFSLIMIKRGSYCHPLLFWKRRKP